MLLITGSLLTAVVLCVWYLRAGEQEMHRLQLSLRVLDPDGHPVAGARVLRLRATVREEVGISDAFGSWRGMLAAQSDELLGLRIEKVSAAGLLLAHRSYRVQQLHPQEVIYLQLHPQPVAARQPVESVRLEITEPYLQRALLTWCRRVGMRIDSDSARVLAIDSSVVGSLRVVSFEEQRTYFSFQVNYTVLRSRATLQKILRGIYAHTAKAYTAYYDEEVGKWYVYNPPGFWRLRRGALLVNAAGTELHPQRGRDRRQLEIRARESICRQQECVVYSAHTKQAVY